MPIMPVAPLYKRPDSFRGQAIMLEFYFNPSLDSCINTYNTKACGEGAGATVVMGGKYHSADTTCTV